MVVATALALPTIVVVSERRAESFSFHGSVRSVGRWLEFADTSSLGCIHAFTPVALLR